MPTYTSASPQLQLGHTALSQRDRCHGLTAGAPSCTRLLPGRPSKSPTINRRPLLEPWVSLGLGGRLILGLLEFSASSLVPAPASLSSKGPPTLMPQHGF